jgi:ferric enterobactin receptor
MYISLINLESSVIRSGMQTTLIMVILGSIVFAPKLANAEGSGRRDISGRVIDAETRETLPYAGVRLLGTRIGTITAVTGHFVLVNVTSAACTLEVSMIGYEPTHFDVEAGSDVSALEFVLVPAVIEEDAFYVYADHYSTWKKSTEVGQMTLSPSNLSDLPGFGEVDLFRSLQLLPGISAVGDGSAGLFVRGGTPDQNLVLFDGMTIYHVDHFFGMFSAFNADAVKDVQMFAGGYPARFGGRMSSVVEITGKTGSTQHARASIGANLLSANAVAEVPISTYGSWLLSIRRSYTDVVQSGLYTSLFSLNGSDNTTTLGPGGGLDGGSRGARGQFGSRGGIQSQAIPDFYFYDLNSKLTFALGSNDILSTSVYAGQDKLAESSAVSGLQVRGEESGDVTRTQSQRTNWGNFGASGTWTRQWGPRVSSKLQIAGSQYTSVYDNSNQLEGASQDSAVSASRFGMSSLAENNQVNDLTSSANLVWHAPLQHNIAFGLSNTNLSTQFESVISDTITRVDRSTAARLMVGYIEDRWQPWNRIELTGGLRATTFDQTNTPYVELRAAAKFFLTDRITLNTAWGRYHQFINRVTNEDILQGGRDFWVVADDTLRPGFSEHAILGLSWDDPMYLLSVQGYRKSFDNLLEYSRRVINPREEETAFHLGTGTALGVEILAQKKEGIASGWISYTLGKVEHQFPAFDDGDSFPATHDRLHEFKTIGIYKSFPWSASATVVYASGAAYTAPESQYVLSLLDGSSQSYINVGDKNGTRLPAYARVDISASLNLTEFGLPDWEIGGSVLNLWDRQNIRYRSYDLSTTPIVISDVLDLGFTPTIFLKATF